MKSHLFALCTSYFEHNCIFLAGSNAHLSYMSMYVYVCLEGRGEGGGGCYPFDLFWGYPGHPRRYVWLRSWERFLTNIIQKLIPPI